MAFTDDILAEMYTLETQNLMMIPIWNIPSMSDGNILRILWE